MLYVTTRTDWETVTAQRALRENRSFDGGFYVPFHVPSFSDGEIAKLGDKSFGQVVADVLNLLFQTRLTSWDIDFCIGRHPVRLQELGHRAVLAETWHNPEWNYDRLVNRLTLLLCKEQAAGDWMKIAIRTAVLFGLFAELKRQGIDCADISVVSGDFSGPMSAWYARSWGLPIGNIVCCCNDNSSLWDLVCHGHLRMDGLSIETDIPEADVSVPVDLERLIFACGGTTEVERYLYCCREGLLYCPEEVLLEKLRKGLFVSVVSSERMDKAISSVYKTHGYLMGPATVLTYCGLQDYRAKTGQTRYAVILADRHPICDAAYVSQKTTIPEQMLRDML